MSSPFCYCTASSWGYRSERHFPLNTLLEGLLGRLAQKGATTQEVGLGAGLKVAYLILVHSNESVLASQRLLPAIWRPDFFYLYVADQSMDELGRRMLDEFLASPATVFHGSANVRVMTTNVLSGWGTLGLVQNELDGLQELLGLGEWDYAINLSGDTYPLVRQADLAERLTFWRGANFVTDPGLRPQRASEVPEWKLARLKVDKWPTGVVEPDQFGSQVLLLFVLLAVTHTWSPTLICCTLS